MKRILFFTFLLMFVSSFLISKEYNINTRDEILPEFDPIGPLCLYSVPPALPGISLNGITGTWEPPAIFTDLPGNFAYTFIPDPGQNANTTIMEITVLPEITPIFGPIGPICQYSEAFLLPDTSLNGITGTWYPPIVHTEETGIFIYTFTPGIGQCTITLSMDVSVIPNPEVNLGDDIITCVTDTVILSAGNQGSVYQWSTGSTGQSIKVFSANETYDMQTISVIVTTSNGCIANDEINVVFDVAACSGINDPYMISGFNIYPNPFRDNTVIEYNLESSAPVNLAVYNHLGQQVAMLADEKQAAGRHQVRWDVKEIQPGIYFYRLLAGKHSATGKMILVR